MLSLIITALASFEHLLTRSGESTSCILRLLPALGIYWTHKNPLKYFILHIQTLSSLTCKQAWY